MAASSWAKIAASLSAGTEKTPRTRSIMRPRKRRIWEEVAFAKGNVPSYCGQQSLNQEVLNFGDNSGFVIGETVIDIVGEADAEISERLKEHRRCGRQGQSQKAGQATHTRRLATRTRKMG